MKPAMLMAGIMRMSLPALADQKAADGCAARLTKDAADIIQHLPWSIRQAPTCIRSSKALRGTW